VPGGRPVAAFASYVRRTPGRAPRTREEYGGDVRLFAAFLDPAHREGASFQKLAVANFSAVRRFVRELVGPRKYGATSVRRKIAALRSYFALQKREGRRIDNPAADVPPPKAPKRLPKVLSEEETSRLLRTRPAAGKTKRSGFATSRLWSCCMPAEFGVRNSSGSI